MTTSTSSPTQTSTRTAAPGSPGTAVPLPSSHSTSRPTGPDTSTATPVIELRSAAFGYGDRTVISDLTTEIRRGEVVALLGPNGSGKSTLVKGLLGLSDHQRGEVRLFGEPLERFHDHTRLGYVPQRHSLSASVRATAAEVVATGRLPHRRWWQPSIRRDAAMVADALDLVGLTDRATADVGRLSGGQQRRVLIARALAAQPDVLLMDEPTAGVDTANQLALTRVLARLAERGTTMVIVTHELEALRPVVTRVLCTSAGRIDFDGPVGAFEAVHQHPRGTDAHHEDETRPIHQAGAVPGPGPLDPATREGRDG
jgi:zinc transport system ATP-binding protein